MPYVISVGLYSVSYLGTIAIDHAFATVLIERSRDHIFNFSDGKATITLQDVALLLGLWIAGPLILLQVIFISLCCYP